MVLNSQSCLRFPGTWDHKCLLPYPVRIHLFFFNIFRSIYWIRWVLCCMLYVVYMYVCVCVCFICIHGACGGQRRYLVPWNRSHGWLWATMWVQGTEPRCSAGTKRALKLLSNPFLQLCEFLYFYLFILSPSLLCACVMCEYICDTAHACVSEDTFTWVPGVELSLSGLCNKHFTY